MRVEILVTMVTPKFRRKRHTALLAATLVISGVVYLLATGGPQPLLAQGESSAQAQPGTTPETVSTREEKAPSRPTEAAEGHVPTPSPTGREAAPGLEPSPEVERLEGGVAEVGAEESAGAEQAPSVTEVPPPSEEEPTDAVPKEWPMEPPPYEPAAPAIASETGQETAQREEYARRRMQAVERRQASISSSLQGLRVEADTPQGRARQVVLISQIARAAMVELGSLREETAAAQLELEQLRLLDEQITNDRSKAPRAVLEGRIPSFAAATRWDKVQQLTYDLELRLDAAFAMRVKLLSELSRLEEDVAAASSLLDTRVLAIEPAQRQILADAADKLQKRLEMSKELADIYDDQATVAAQAYDEASRFSKELSEAMVTVRSRGLGARVPDQLSWQTLTDLGTDISQVKQLLPAAVEQYQTDGRPLVSLRDEIFRGVAILAIVAAVIIIWLALPRWIYQIAQGRLRNDNAHNP